MKKIFLLAVAIFFAGNFLASNVHAEIKTYTGVGEFVIKNETLDVAKNNAKLVGMRNIAEQIFVNVQSSTEVKNSELIHDEIILESENFLHIVEVKYKIESEDEEILVKAFVTAEVDSEEIEKIINNFRRSNNE